MKLNKLSLFMIATFLVVSSSANAMPMSTICNPGQDVFNILSVSGGSMNITIPKTGGTVAVMGEIDPVNCTADHVCALTFNLSNSARIVSAHNHSTDTTAINGQPVASWPVYADVAGHTKGDSPGQCVYISGTPNSTVQVTYELKQTSLTRKQLEAQGHRFN